GMQDFNVTAVQTCALPLYQRGRERHAVHADLPLADQAHLALVHELDRILDRDDVALEARVDSVDDRRERRGLARAGLAGHENQEIGRAVWYQVRGYSLWLR